MALQSDRVVCVAGWNCFHVALAVKLYKLFLSPSSEPMDLIFGTLERGGWKIQSSFKYVTGGEGKHTLMNMI